MLCLRAASTLPDLGQGRKLINPFSGKLSLSGASFVHQSYEKSTGGNTHTGQWQAGPQKLGGTDELGALASEPHPESPGWRPSTGWARRKRLLGFACTSLSLGQCPPSPAINQRMPMPPRFRDSTGCPAPGPGPENEGPGWLETKLPGPTRGKAGWKGTGEMSDRLGVQGFLGVLPSPARCRWPVTVATACGGVLSLTERGRGDLGSEEV